MKTIGTIDPTKLKQIFHFNYTIGYIIKKKNIRFNNKFINFFTY